MTVVTTIAAAVTAATLLGSCSSGFDATSVQPYAPSDGILAESGDIRVLNALVVAAEGADSGLITLTIANRGDRDDRLTAITSPAGGVEIDGDDALPAGGALTLGADTPTTATISSLGAEPGQTVELKISFSRAEPVTLRTVVVPATGDYASLTPSPTPTFTPLLPTSTGSPSETPSE